MPVLSHCKERWPLAVELLRCKFNPDGRRPSLLARAQARIAMPPACLRPLSGISRSPSKIGPWENLLVLLLPAAAAVTAIGADLNQRHSPLAPEAFPSLGEVTPKRSHIRSRKQLRLAPGRPVCCI